MSQAGDLPPARKGLARYARGKLSLVLVMVVGLAMTAVGFNIAVGFLARQAQGEFKRPAEQYAAAVRRTIDRPGDVLQSMVPSVTASGSPDRWVFQAVAGTRLTRLPAMRLMGWVPRVPADMRSEYEARADLDGLYGFQITEPAPAGDGFAVAGQRDVYFPLFFLTPADGNQKLSGVDLGADPAIAAAMAEARDSGQIVTTRQAGVLSPVAPGNAVVTLVPVYGGEAVPAGITERRIDLTGYIVGVTDIEALLGNGLGNLASTLGLDVHIFERNRDGSKSLVVFWPSPLNPTRPVPSSLSGLRAGLHNETVHGSAGWRWRIVVSPAAGHFGRAFNPLPLGVVLLGSALTFWLLQYLISLSARTRIIEQTVGRRTQQLRRSNEALAREIADRTKAEEKRLDLERELSHTNKMESLGTLAGGIAHEINTPVQYVGENLHFLREGFEALEKALRALEAHVGQRDGQSTFDHLAGNEDLAFFREEIPQSLEQSLEGIDRIVEIVKAVTSFSYPDAMRESEPRQIDINKAIEDTLTLSRNQYKNVADVETGFADNLPPVSCFPGQINQVILNLLVNAAQAIQERHESGRGRISVSTRLVGDRVEIQVSDTGVGIPPGVIDRVFDPFFTTKRPGSGTGQGLAISHAIVTRDHGGTIAVESTPGVGATFTVRLPVVLSVAAEQAA